MGAVSPCGVTGFPRQKLHVYGCFPLGLPLWEVPKREMEDTRSMSVKARRSGACGFSDVLVLQRGHQKAGLFLRSHLPIPPKENIRSRRFPPTRVLISILWKWLFSNPVHQVQFRHRPRAHPARATKLNQTTPPDFTHPFPQISVPPTPSRVQFPALSVARQESTAAERIRRERLRT